MSAELFFLRLANLPADQRAALKEMGTRPFALDVVAHDAFTSVYWNSSFRRDSSRIVAGLYFWHPMPRGRVNLPQALAKIWGERERNEKLLHNILAAPLLGLPPFLFEAVRRLRAAKVPLDWPRLLLDLGKWDRPHVSDSCSIQEDWANCWLHHTALVFGSR